ncbi:MAG TPA: helix-turn-helix domain-containing protein [Dehalococcoidia bacterium]|jgi:transposase
MYTVHFTEADHTAVQALSQDKRLSPAERDRVEMLLLSDAGWSPPRIATHLGACAKTVRLVVTRFAETGVAGIRRKRPGPPPDTAKRERITAVLTALLAQERTWTAAQLAAALSEQGLALSPRQRRKYLRPLAGWRRTVHSLQHRQDPARATHARRQLAGLEQRGRKAG